MTTQTNGAVQDLTPQEVQTRLDAGSILLIDVREPSEYEAERIPGALLFPLSTFDASRLPPDAERCIVCTRCVRFCVEVAKDHVLEKRERGT